MKDPALQMIRSFVFFLILIFGVHNHPSKDLYRPQASSDIPGQFWLRN